jgi:hypothetical protein
LRAVENTVQGPDGEPLAVEATPREMARGILQVLRLAEIEDGAGVAVVPAGRHSVSFENPDTASIIGGEPVLYGPSGEAQAASPSVVSPPAEVGDVVPVADGAMFLELAERDGDGRQRWWITTEDGRRIAAKWGRETAEAAARQFIDTGRITA